MERVSLSVDFEGFFDIHIWVPFVDPEDVANLICGTEEETSVHVLCECEALFSAMHIMFLLFWIRRMLQI
jgi:hypothetical protein